jgi:type I restriction enzyme S subunit
MSNQNWEIKNLGEVCDLSTGGTPSRSHPEYFNNGTIQWLVSGDIHRKEIFECDGRITEEGHRNSSTRYLPLNSVMIALNGQGKTRGTVALLRTKAMCNQSLVSIYPKDSDVLSCEYLYRVLDGRYEELRKMTGDAGNERRGLNMPLIRSVSITVPPLSEQKRIVGILDEKFKAIEELKKVTEAQIQDAKELFESRLSILFAEIDCDSKTLNEVSINLDSRRIPITKNKRTIGDIPYYGASGIVDWVKDYIFDEELLLISEDGANLLARTYPIAFSVKGRTWVNNHAHVLKFEDLVSQKFVEYYLNSISLHPYISGMAQPKLNQRFLNSIKIPFSDFPVREQVVKELDMLVEKTKNLNKIFDSKIIDLEELKKSYLEQAFAGKL